MTLPKKVNEEIEKDREIEKTDEINLEIGEEGEILGEEI